MKKKNYIFALAIITFIAVVFIVNNHAYAKEDMDKSLISESSPTFTVKNAFQDMGDGWIYGFELDYYKDSNSIEYIFDGYNLKYKSLDNYYVPIIDKESGEEIDKIQPDYITLSISQKYQKDILEINSFFNKNQFNKEIKLIDLKELKVENIDKKIIVDLFNKAVSSEMITKVGEYGSAPYLGKESKKSFEKDMVGEWQIAYLNVYGYITEINIEFIYNDGTYLSDLIASKRANEKEIAIFNNIEQLEVNTIKTQKIRNDNLLEKISSSDLNKLFETFESSLAE